MPRTQKRNQRRNQNRSQRRNQNRSQRRNQNRHHRGGGLMAAYKEKALSTYHSAMGHKDIEPNVSECKFLGQIKKPKHGTKLPRTQDIDRLKTKYAPGWAYMKKLLSERNKHLDSLTKAIEGLKQSKTYASVANNPKKLTKAVMKDSNVIKINNQIKQVEAMINAGLKADVGKGQVARHNCYMHVEGDNMPRCKFDTEWLRQAIDSNVSPDDEPKQITKTPRFQAVMGYGKMQGKNLRWSPDYLVPKANRKNPVQQCRAEHFQ